MVPVLLAGWMGLTPAHAAESNLFTGARNNDWSNGGNWSRGRVPLSTDIAIIDRLPQLWLGARPGAAGSLYIGLGKTGSLYAEQALSVGQLTLGAQAGSKGTLTLLGSAARLLSTGTVLAGQNGRGEINLYRGASLSARNMVLGYGLSGDGALVVAGQSAATVSGTLTLGHAGKGKLDISGGGRLMAGSLVLGGLAGSSGTASASGSGTKINAGTLVIGKAGTGALAVTTGASLAAGSLTLGQEKTGNGRLALSGGGTSLATTGRLTIGRAGTGAATVFTGATLSASTMVLGETAGSAGGLVGGNGGTVVSTTGDLVVGAAGRGSLRLQDGAIGKAGRLVIGASAGGNGAAVLSGGGTALTTGSPVEIGRSGIGSLVLTGEARLNAATIDLGVNAGSAGVLSIGARHGEIARGAGYLNASAIRFGAGSGALVFNLGGPTYGLSARLSGKGSVLVDAGSVAMSADSSAFTGTTRISGGMLAVNGTLGGTVSVGGYGTLAGTGTVGSVSVGSGGSIAPAGKGTGMLTVRGDLSFAKGSHFQAGIDPARNRADLLKVTGRTAIGSGAVLDVVQESAITLDRRDRVLTSGGGISGKFDTVTSNYAFVTPTVSNDGHNLFVSLHRNDLRFASAAVDGGGRTVAAVADRLDSTNPLYRQIVSLSARQATATFGDLAGTIHATPALAGFDVGRFARSAALERAGANVSSDTPAPSALTAYVAAEPGDAARAFAALLEEEKRRGPVGWARAYGGYSTRAEDGGDRIGSTGGMLFGLDGEAGDGIRIGILGGIGMGQVHESARRATAESRDYTLGLYGGTEVGPLSLRFGTTWVHQEISSDRTARFNGFNETLTAAYGADAVQTYVEAGREFNMGGVAVEPFANLALTFARTDAFRESGGNAALSVTAAESTQAETLIGLRAARNFDLGQGSGRLRGMLGWNHVFEASGEGPLFSFAGSQSFSLKGAETAGDSLAVEAGLDLTADGGRTTLGLTYGGNFAAGAQSHLVKLTLSRQF